MLRAGKKPVDDTWGADSPEHYGKLTTGEGETTEIETLHGSYVTYYQKSPTACFEEKSFRFQQKKLVTWLKLSKRHLKAAKKNERFILTKERETVSNHSVETLLEK